VIVAVVALDTALVVTVNVAVCAPAATVTEVGTTALELFDESPTTVPPDAEGPLNVTVPADGLPPVTVEGVSETLTSEAGVMVRIPVPEVLFTEAIIVAGVELETVVVFTENSAVVIPAAIETLPGTVAFGELEDRVTTTPFAGAAPVRVTVPVEVVPPVTLDGASVTDKIPVGFTVKVAKAKEVPSAQPRVTAVAVVTVVVVTEKVAVVLPAGIFTDAGTVATGLLELNPIVRPPAGAGFVRVTVPVAGRPPTTFVGVTASCTTGTTVVATGSEAIPFVTT